MRGESEEEGNGGACLFFFFVNIHIWVFQKTHSNHFEDHPYRREMHQGSQSSFFEGSKGRIRKEKREEP